MSRHNYVTPSQADAEQIRKALPNLANALRDGHDFHLNFGRDFALEVHSDLRQSVLLYLTALARGEPVAVIPLASQMTTQGAADHLNVSRPHLIKLLERGEIPFEMVGKHRRIKFEDVMTYRNKRSQGRRELLQSLTAEDEAQGLT